jgi:hypothetical protein
MSAGTAVRPIYSIYIYRIMQLQGLHKIRQEAFFGRLFHFRSFIGVVIYGFSLWFFVRNIIDATSDSFKNDFIFLTSLVLCLSYLCWVFGRRLLYVPSIGSLGLFSCGLLYFIDPPLARLGIILASSAALYMSFLGMYRIRSNVRDMTAKSFLSITLIASLFVAYSVGYGIYTNYEVSLVSYLIVNYVLVFSLTFCSLRIYSTNVRRVGFYSAVLSFIMLELTWMANFWPFNYFTMAGASLIFYYILWDLFHSALVEELSKRATLKKTLIALLLLALILISSRWQINE